MDIKKITEILVANEIKPSYPRIHIYRYLNNQKNHPTVDEIYNNVIEEIPTLSKTTVYNTLELFEDNNIVKVLHFDDTEKHYEIIVEDHSHFKCSNCGGVFDIPYDKNNLNLIPKDYEEYKVKDIHILLKGLCPDCK